MSVVLPSLASLIFFCATVNLPPVSPLLQPVSASPSPDNKVIVVLGATPESQNNPPWRPTIPGSRAHFPRQEMAGNTASGQIALNLSKARGSNLRPPWRSKRNVLLLIADDVGVDKVATYVDLYNNNSRSDDNIAGVAVPCTPTIEGLAASGVDFVNAWVSPTCSPTRAALMSGTHPFRNKVYEPADAALFTDNVQKTIAQSMKEIGYKNALFGKWHLGEALCEGPVDNGWDLHQGFRAGAIEDYHEWTKVKSDVPCEKVETTVLNYATTEFSEDARDWINQQSGNWMATVAFNAAHSVISDFGRFTLEDQEPPPGCGCHHVNDPKNEDEVYRATVECMDRKIGELLAGIHPAILENTTIIFLGDNGTEDQRSEHFPEGRAKGSLYEGGVNVPIVIADGYAYLHGRQATAGAGRIVRPGRISEALVQAVDLYPTIAEIAGADAKCAVDGVSLIPLMEHSARAVREASFAQLSDTHVAVRNERHKLIEQRGVFGVRRQLFDLATDRWEQNNLLADGVNDFEATTIRELTRHMNAILSVSSCTL